MNYKAIFHESLQKRDWGMKISHRIIEGADHLIFEGGGYRMYGLFQKKYPTHWFRWKKFLQGNTWQNNPTLKKIPFMAYNAGKNLTLLYVRKKNFHQRFGEKYSYPIPNQERKYCTTGHHHHLLAFVLQQILQDTAGC